MIAWFVPTGRPIHCLLTKSDKLTRQEQSKTLCEAKAVAQGLSGNITLQLFSSLKKTGIEDVEKMVGNWLTPEQPPTPKQE
jgi:GTP-binding protein